MEDNSDDKDILCIGSRNEEFSSDESLCYTEDTSPIEVSQLDVLSMLDVLSKQLEVCQEVVGQVRTCLHSLRTPR